MNQDEYIEQRLDHQMKWYSGKSIVNQRKYKRWQVRKIVTALLITTLSLIDPESLTGFEFPKYIRYVVGLLGAFIIFIESFVKIFDYKKLWIGYRMTAENLKKEKLLFKTGSKPYNNKTEAFNLLVQRSESIMENEKMTWEQLVAEKDG